MDPLAQPDIYGAINIYYTTTNLFYVILFISEAYTLQNNTKIDGQAISYGELVVKTQYLFSMQKTLIFIGNNIHCNRLSYFQHAK